MPAGAYRHTPFLQWQRLLHFVRNDRGCHCGAAAIQFFVGLLRRTRFIRLHQWRVSPTRLNFEFMKSSFSFNPKSAFQNPN
jgi:hypothetical protein